MEPGGRQGWADHGGQQGRGRSTLELFLKHYGLKNPEVKASVVIGDNEQGVRTVAGNPGAIGYVSIGTAEYNAGEAGIPIRLLAVGGVAASTATVLDGSFPISRPPNLVTHNPPEGLTKRFIDFAQSKAVHDLVEQHFFVPIKD